MFVPLFIQSLDSLKFAEVRHILSRNMERPTMPGPGPVKAPLATPEPIEISEYAQVRVSTPPDGSLGRNTNSTLLSL